MKIKINKIIQLTLALAVLGFNLSVSQLAQAGSSTNTGSMNSGHYPTLTSPSSTVLLSNGKVLFMGGYNMAGDKIPAPEIYDPATGIWQVKPMAMAIDSNRVYFTTTLLSNGKVLVAGGRTDDSVGSTFGLSNAELFDPLTATWTNTGTLNNGRSYFTATLLPNGKVLVAGGYGNYGAELSSVELYDPTTGLWTTNGNLLAVHAQHTATLLQNGKVLIAGGVNFDATASATNAEIYDPGTGTATAIKLSSAAKLSSGAFQIGVSNAVGASLTALASTNVTLPATNWTVIGPMTESPPGQFKFTDTQATNISKRFYRVRSP